MRNSLAGPTEHQEQAVVVRWFDMQYPDITGRLFAVPNGGDRHRAVAGKLKAEGVRPGVPDLWLPVPRRGFSGLVIEMKRRKGGKPSPEQLDWLAWLAEQGFMTVICAGAEAAIESIRGYLDGDQQVPA
ncbi:VRR-NUC domain-containing protein [Alloalcanivorax sp. C16-1]|uniref:VRR-NUC domain-containing protein n=1 Tax=Alloalcanivorax sp. C16-1 TaxID=3390051 RepID=UPI003970FA08